MATQFYSGAFDDQTTATVRADFFRGQNFSVSGPTKFDAGSFEWSNGQRGVTTRAFAEVWLVTATLTAAAPKAKGPAKVAEQPKVA